MFHFVSKCLGDFYQFPFIIKIIEQCPTYILQYKRINYCCNVQKINCEEFYKSYASNEELEEKLTFYTSDGSFIPIKNGGTC